MRPVKHHPWSEEDYTSRSWVMGIIQVLEASYFYGRDSWYRVDYPSSPSNRKTIPLFERFVGLWIVCETIRVTNPPFMNYETGKSMLKSHSNNNNNNNVWDENGNNFEFLSFFLEIIIRAMFKGRLDDDPSRPWHGFPLLFKIQLSRSTSLLPSWVFDKTGGTSFSD